MSTSSPTGPTSADLAAAADRLAAQLAEDGDLGDAWIVRDLVSAGLIGRLRHYLSTGSDQARIAALADVLVVSDWRATQFSADRGDSRECVDPGDQEHDHEACRDAVADATSADLAFVDGFDIRQDGGQFRVECGSCGWTMRGLVGYAAAWTAADQHADVCDGA